MVDRVYHLLDTMAEAHCVRERGTNASQWFARVHHLLDTMAEAHCVRDKGTIRLTNGWLCLIGLRVAVRVVGDGV